MSKWGLTDGQLAARRLEVIERIAVEKEQLQQECGDLREQIAILEAENTRAWREVENLRREMHKIIPNLP